MNRIRIVMRYIKQVTPIRRFSASNESSRSEWRKNGTPEILIGGSILLLIGLDFFLQRNQDKQRRGVMHDLQTIIRQDEKQQKDSEEDVSKRPIIFKCKVKRIPNLFDGSRCLKNVQVGDEVGVIEEGVGPAGMYNLCRLEEKQKNNELVHFGIFPIQCLEKIQKS